MKPERRPSATLPPEGAEPKAGLATVPMWLVILLFVLGYWAQVFVDNHSGRFDARVYAPFLSLKQVRQANPEVAQDMVAFGRELFTGKGCIACHQTSGQGLPNQFPPLAGSAWVQATSPNRIIRIVLNGAQGQIDVKGQTFNNAMVPFRELLNNEEVAAVLTFVRQEWGNQAPEVKPDQVKAIREKTKDMVGPWHPADLLKLPENE
jgi:mono/diheme cytochrome c family protein